MGAEPGERLLLPGAFQLSAVLGWDEVSCKGQMLLQNLWPCHRDYTSWKLKLQSANTNFNGCVGQRHFPGAHSQQWEWQGAPGRAARQKKTEVS